MSEVFGLEVVKVETLSPPDSMAINDLMRGQQASPLKMPHEADCANPELPYSDSSMNGDGMQITYNFSTRKRGLSWSDMETRTLLVVWTERNNLFEADDLCSANGQIYRTIANEMVARGYPKSAIQCKTRMKTLKRAYKHCRMLLRTRGKVKKLCRFYKEIDYIVRHTMNNRKKLSTQSGSNLDSNVVPLDGKQPANASWDSSKNNATDGSKFDQLSMPLMECEVIENELSDEIEISDDDDDYIDEEEENMSASTAELKTSQSVVTVSSVSLPAESKPVETKLEAISLSPAQSKWLNVISLEDSVNSSNANHVSNNRNLLLDLAEIGKPNSQNQPRSAFSFPETSNIFLPEKEPISHLNGGSKPFSSKSVMNQLEMTNVQPLEAFSEPIAKELWVNNMQGARNIMQKQEIGQFSQLNENRVGANAFQTNKHFHQPLDIIQISQSGADKSHDSRPLTSSASSSYPNAAAASGAPLMPMEILATENEARAETSDARRQRRQTAEVSHFEETLRSVVENFTNSLEKIQHKQMQTETLRLDLEMKKLEVERERQALEREKIKTEIQRHREDREHQFSMLKMILGHVSSSRPSVPGENITLDSSTSLLLNSMQPKS